MQIFKRILLTAFGALALSAGSGHGEEHVPELAPANTSASRAFAGSPNGIPGGMTSVSKVDVHTLLYPGSTTRVLAHYLPWWGPDPRGVAVGYRSDDPSQALRTFEDMHSRGVDGVVVDWYGKGHFVDTAWKASMPALARFPRMTFSIMIDSGTFKFNACRGCDLTDTILYHLDYAAREYFTSKQYLRYDGHPVVFEFAIEAAGKADWARIRAAHPEIYWIHTHASGFDVPYSNGGFVWVQPSSRMLAHVGSLRDRAHRARFYEFAMKKGSGPITVGGAWSGFDDSRAPWAAAEPSYLEQACGQTWLDTFRSINDRYDARHQLPFVQLITWNDYEEGTALEPGIASCAAVSAAQTGRTLSVRLTHPETVDHLELYRQLGASSFRRVGRYPADTTSMPLPDAEAAVYFIEAVGKPFIQNVVSPATVVR